MSPKDTESYYSPNGRSEKGYNQMYLVPLYDLTNKVYTDAVIQPVRKENEFAALYELIDRHAPCSGTVPVFIADRGFHAYNVFAHAIENVATHRRRSQTDLPSASALAAGGLNPKQPKAIRKWAPQKPGISYECWKILLFYGRMDLSEKGRSPVHAGYRAGVQKADQEIGTAGATPQGTG